MNMHSKFGVHATLYLEQWWHMASWNCCSSTASVVAVISHVSRWTWTSYWLEACCIVEAGLTDPGELCTVEILSPQSLQSCKFTVQLGCTGEVPITVQKIPSCIFWKNGRI